jgi:hypothetical protein
VLSAPLKLSDLSINLIHILNELARIRAWVQRNQSLRLEAFWIRLVRREERLELLLY